MLTLHRTTLTILSTLFLVTLICHAPVSAQETIYSSDIAGRVSPTEEQRPLLQDILERNQSDLTAILIRNGIDPNNSTPVATKIYRASGALSALGKRTRGELTEILDPEQMQIYDQIAKEVEQRIRDAVKFVGRGDASELK